MLDTPLPCLTEVVTTVSSWERRAAFFKIWFCFSRQNSCDFDFHMITEAVECSSFYLPLLHLKLPKSLHLLLLRSCSETTVSSSQVSFNDPLLLGSADRSAVSWYSMYTVFCSHSHLLHKILSQDSFSYPPLLVLLKEAFCLVDLVFSKKRSFCCVRLNRCSICFGMAVARWHQDTNLLVPCAVSSWSLGEGAECQRGLCEAGSAGKAEQCHSEADRVLPEAALQKASEKGESLLNVTVL